MVRLAIFLVPVIVAMGVAAVADVLMSRDDEVRVLPKFAWLVVALFVPVLGPVAWMFKGRPSAGRAQAGGSGQRPGPTQFPEYDRPGRARAASPDDDAEFLRKVRERAEEQRRRHREQQRAAQDPDAEGQSSKETED